MEKETYTLEQLLQDYKDGYIRTFEQLERAVMLLKGAGRNTGLNDLAADIHANAVAHGWWDEARSFGDIVALCHSELSEALEAYRDGEELVHGCCGHCTFEASCDHPAPAGETGCKPEGVAVEMIDCIIRILDWCGKMGVDVDGVLAMKHAYNKGRPYRHGGEGAVKIGQKVTRYPVSFSEPDGKKGQKPMTGTVVYIHPLGRFHIVEFELRGGKVQESFQGAED